MFEVFATGVTMPEHHGEFFRFRFYVDRLNRFRAPVQVPVVHVVMPTGKFFSALGFVAGGWLPAIGAERHRLILH